MMCLGFNKIKDTQEKFYSGWQKDEFLEAIIGVDGKYDERFVELLKRKYS